MSSELPAAPAASIAPSKRAHSTSPPPPPTTSLPADKRIRLDVEEPASVPPNLVETVVDAATLPVASTSTSTSSSSAAVDATVDPSAPVVPPTAPAAAKGSNGAAQGKGKGKSRKVKGRKIKPPKPGGAEEAAAFDIVELLGKERVKELERKVEEDGWDAYSEAVKEWGKDKEGKDIEVRIAGISDHGDGLAILTPASFDGPTRLLTIPFTLPGELVLVHVHRHEPEIFLSHGDLIEIVEKSPERSYGEGEEKVVLESEARLSEKAKAELEETRKKFGDRVQCRYFGTCSGCQYQPLSYAKQLTLKEDVVRRAFANFSGLDPSLIPTIGSTLPSPLEYAYRTKLTPHFQTPPTGNPKGGRKRGKKGEEQSKALEEMNERLKEKEWEVTIGFEQKGRKRIVDIEECPIATRVINEAMVGEREKVKANISSFKRGATLLLRDSLPPRALEVTTKPIPYVPSTEAHICITDHHATVREQVGTIEFEQQAGSFFQNNNSILPALLDAVKEAIGPRKEGEKERYLVDAYTGSGLFAISLADMFERVEGVEIDKASIKWAKRNATYNEGEGRGQVGFIAGKAEEIFKDIPFPSAQTTLIIDPPRKGCDDLFLDQLLAFNPVSVVYISCNVRTQARDIGYLVSRSNANGSTTGYRIESARACDLFVNTHHAEGLAVLRRDV